MTSRWDEAKKIPIDHVAQRLGVQLANRNVIRCPFPSHDDKNASFSINRRTNLCYCHACGRGGSVIDFTAIMIGRPASEAVTWLTSSFGRPSSSRPTVSGLPRATPSVSRPSRQAAAIHSRTRLLPHYRTTGYKQTPRLDRIGARPGHARGSGLLSRTLGGANYRPPHSNFRP
jgi:hypothetical protein